VSAAALLNMLIELGAESLSGAKNFLRNDRDQLFLNAQNTIYIGRVRFDLSMNPSG